MHFNADHTKTQERNINNIENVAQLRLNNIDVASSSSKHIVLWSPNDHYGIFHTFPFHRSKTLINYANDNILECKTDEVFGHHIDQRYRAWVSVHLHCADGHRQTTINEC